MLKILWEAVKGLSLSDKILLGVSLVILINPYAAFIVAALVVTYFIYKLGKAVLDAS